ncbi:M28 family peptidase [Paraburkholderia sp. DHOC27]|uniref:M28 family peptidase n=1 Tax=Paraburkholderia sp. DHOC27 TaxID=2303330 RepID=UPI0015F3010B|nr:M28 family peptidase [Paraburkholderia sp. DHOC27]
MHRDIPCHVGTSREVADRDYHALHEDFASLCDFGGRLLGSESEQKAVTWAHDKLSEIGGQVSCYRLEVPVWCTTRSRLTFVSNGESFECQPMLRTVPTPAEGLTGTVLDLGRGRAEDYANIGDAAIGKILLVEHEYPFSPTHVHRREKIRLAIRHGAKAVLMLNPTGDGGLLSGASQTLEGFDPIPCGYISNACAARLRAQRSDETVVRIFLDGLASIVHAGIPSLIIGDPALPRILLSAHIDGHPLGESALDNATGVAVALAATRRLAPQFRTARYALQTILFTAEEWALFGSAHYLAQLTEDECRNIKLNVNLDIVAGSPNLTALISGFPHLRRLVETACAESSIEVSTYLPLVANSDHYNFARSGIPAFRLLAGFDEPHSRVRHILSGSDRRDQVDPAELERALEFVCSVIACATRESESFARLA